MLSTRQINPFILCHPWSWIPYPQTNDFSKTVSTRNQQSWCRVSFMREIDLSLGIFNKTWNSCQAIAKSLDQCRK